MSPRKLLLLTAAVFALFFFIFFFERKMPTTAERQSKGDLHWDLPEDRVLSVRLEKEGSIVELVREGESWRITRPAPYPADSFAASDLARQLSQLKRVGGDTSEARPEDYGLTKPTAKATITWKDPNDPQKKSTRTVEFGIDIPGTDTSAARVEGQNRVLFVPSSVAASVKKPASDFQSKDVFGGSTTDVAGIDIERGRGHLVLSQRDGIWWMDQPVKDLADAEETSRLAGDLTALRVTEFLPSQKDNLANWGLAPALYRVMLSDLKGKTTTAEFGATRTDGNSIYASREGQVFTVPSSIGEELSKEGVGFREPHLVKFDRAKVSGLEGAFGEERYALARGKDGGWSAGGKNVLAGSAEDVMNGILDVKSKSFLDEAETHAAAAREPSATVKITFTGGEPWEIRIFGGSSEPAATVSRRPGGFRLSSDPSASLLAVFKKATAPPAPTASPTPAPTRKP